MKKWIKVIPAMLMTVCLLAGCGGSTGVTESEKSEEPAVEEKITLDSGYWVLETMTMEGVEFTSEEISVVDRNYSNKVLTVILKNSNSSFVIYRGTPDGDVPIFIFDCEVVIALY